ncbi:MAG: hypothetical protein ACRDS9_16650, partial [Pseudonocardiaceae bacterium]
MAAQFTKAQYSPGLFDLAQDMTGGLPIKFVERWLDSEQADEDAVRLLREHEIQGYSVVSVSAGLIK